MAQKLAIWDDSLGRIRISQTILSQVLSFTDYDFDVGSGGATVFNLGVTFSTQKLDVYINGRLAREGSGNDFTRNGAGQTITTTFTVPQNGWVRVRLYTN